MPKIVDHDERRAQLSHVVWQVISKYGIDNLTLQKTAAEAGWSAGVLAHYFKTKDGLLMFAFHLSNQRITERLQELMADAERAADTLRSVILELCPLDAERKTEADVWISFLGRTLSRPAFAREFERHYQTWRSSMIALVRQLVAEGSLRPEADAEVIAERLMAFVDGLNVQAFVEPKRFDDARIRGLVDEELGVFLKP